MREHELPKIFRSVHLFEDVTEDDIPPHADYLGCYADLAECAEDHNIQGKTIWTINNSNGTAHYYSLATAEATASYEPDHAQNHRLHAALGVAATTHEPDTYLAWKLLDQRHKDVDTATTNLKRPPAFHAKYPSMESFALAKFHTIFDTWDEDLPEPVTEYLASPDLAERLREAYDIVETPDAVFVFTNETLQKRRWPGTRP